MEITNPPKAYQSYGNIFGSCQYHVLFCTKYRRKVLNDEIIADLRQLLNDNQTEFGYDLISSDIAPDHVHLILAIPPTLNIYSVITKIKGNSSHILREKYQVLRSRIPTLWTRFSMITTLGSVDLKDVETFLEDQKRR